jgi:hypothetical protein
VGRELQQIKEWDGIERGETGEVLRTGSWGGKKEKGVGSAKNALVER